MNSVWPHLDGKAIARLNIEIQIFNHRIVVWTKLTVICTEAKVVLSSFNNFSNYLMDPIIQERLAQAEDRFLSALTGGEDDLASYHNDWSSLEVDFSAAIRHGNLSEETTTVAHAVASRVGAIADCLLKLEELQQNWKTQMHEDMELILLDVDSSHFRSGDRTLSSHVSSPHSTSDSSFIPLAYDWLLANLHNPYPPPDLKKTLVQRSGCTASSLNAWFVGVRRRIGWTDICREYFNNRRTDTVDAAYRALVKEDPNRRVNPELIQLFVAMKVKAEGLYSAIFKKSALANALDNVVKDMGKSPRFCGVRE